MCSIMSSFTNINSFFNLLIELTSTIELNEVISISSFTIK